MTTYTYSIQNDFLNHIVSSDRLTTEIVESAIVIALDHIDTIGDDCIVYFKADLSPGDNTVLDGVIAAHNGQGLPVEPSSVVISNTARVASEKPDVSRITTVTHSWADKTTWCEQSVMISNEVLGNSGDNVRYIVAHNCIIDTYHGKLFGEDDFKDSGGNSYRISVKVNGSSKTEQNPHFGTGGDFTVNYLDGYVDFLSALNPEDVVTATYHYQNGSRFTLKPSAGKKLKLSLTEVQFSTDIVLTDTIIFQTYGYAGVFAPQLGYPFTTLIPIQTVKYKTIQDYINDSFRSYPLISALGGSGWRGMTFDIVIFDWDYISAAVLRSDYGMETRVYLEHNTPLQGNFATASFYFTSEDC